MPLLSTRGGLSALAFGLLSFKVAAVDLYFYLVSMLLPGNGTNGAQNNTFIDGSANAFTITRSGNTTQGTFAQFSQTGWSYYFDGSENGIIRFTDAGSVLDLPANFTVELFVYQPALATLRATANLFFTTENLDSFQFAQDASVVSLYMNSISIVSSATKAPLNAWSHYAIVRSGSTVTLYLNGTSVGSGSSAYSVPMATLMIGGQDRGTAYHGCNAYISNFRVVKGTAVYTSTFVPPTAPLTAISGTSLLTCNSNGFKDTSSNALVATTIGSTLIVFPFSPFAPTLAYVASTNGASGYLDGSGDYLTAPDNAGFDFGSGSFTIELWIYPTGTSLGALYSKATADTNGVIVAINNGVAGRISFYADSTGGGPWEVLVDSSTNVSFNSWSHIACVRNSNTWTIYINGVASGTATNSMTPTNQAVGPSIGFFYSGLPANYQGYLSDVRVVKGTAVYTGNFTPPTAPLTAIANTQLLLNFKNAAITDVTSKNNLETVSSAQTSTTQSKWGGSSMLFDGNGDNLTVNSNQMHTLTAGDFTIEAWVYMTSNAPIYDAGIVSYGAASSSVGWVFALTGSNAGGTLNRMIWSMNYSGAAGSIVYGVAGVSLNTWTHIAVTYTGTTLKFFLNGVLDQTGTVTAVPTVSSSYKLYVGTASYDPSGTQRSLTGHLQDVRITKMCRYTATFTPPSAPFPLL